MGARAVAIIEPRGMESAPTVGSGKLLAGAVGFLALTAAVFWWQFHRLPADGALPALGSLRWEYALLILLVLPVETLTAATRMWLLCRVLHPGVSLRVCVQSDWANVAVSLLTPSQSGGGPGLIYILHRRAGVSVGTGVTLTVLSGLSTMAGLLMLGLYSLLVSGIGTRGPLFLVAVSTITGLAAAALLGAAWPGAVRAVLAALSRAIARVRRRQQSLADWWAPLADRTGPAADRMDRTTARLVDLCYGYHADVQRVLRHGKTCLVLVCLLSVIFLLARALMPYLCARFLGVEGVTLGEVFDAQIGLIFLVFFAPTPGGAGITEGASLSIMADIIPAPVAPYYNLLWRSSTTYLAALAGFVCLGRTLARDAARITRRRSAQR